MEILYGTIDIPSIILYPVIIGILIYIHTRYKFSYWRKQGVPTPRPWPLLGNFTFFLQPKLKIYEIDAKLCKQYGKRFGLYEPSANMLMISDPEDIKAVMVKDFDKFIDRRAFGDDGGPFSKNLTNLTGEKWNAVRNVITPSFSAAKMKHMIDCVVTCSKELTECLVETSKSTKEFNAKRLFGCYTMDVIAGTAFRTNINSIKNPDHEFVKMARKVFDQGFSWKLVLMLNFPKLAAKLGVTFIDDGVANYFANLVRKIINLRKYEEKSPDFLSLLKESMEEGAFDDSKPKKPKKPKIETSNEDWKKESKKCTYIAYSVSDGHSSRILYIFSLVMTEDLVIAQCVLFFLAGYDTTASTLSMVAYNIAIHPECQDKLIKEIDIATEKHGTLTYDAIGEMPYLKAVLKETLRLYGPATRLERKCTQNYQLGNIFLEKGTLVAIPTYSLHHDAEYWPEPEKFDPERFMGDPNDINPYTYLPFGIGRRNCVAMRFAEMEVKVAIASMLSKVRLFKSPKTSVPPKFSNGGGMQPIDMVIGVETRIVA
ncbi:Cytochrome P450 3A5 [Nymphon striatum]|nr:Cytochrome P450 3A5 [Nymphon striatum]